MLGARAVAENASHCARRSLDSSDQTRKEINDREFRHLMVLVFPGQVQRARPLRRLYPVTAVETLLALVIEEERPI